MEATKVKAAQDFAVFCLFVFKHELCGDGELKRKRSEVPEMGHSTTVVLSAPGVI